MQRRREGLRGKKRNRGERGEVRNWVWGSFDGLNRGRGRRKKLMKKAAKKGLRLRFAGSGERRLRQGLVAVRVSGDLSFFSTSLSLIFKGSDSLGLVSSEIERLLLQLREEEDDATSGLGATKQDPDGPDNGVHVHVDDDLVEKNKEPGPVLETCIQKKSSYTCVEDDLAAENKEPSFVLESCIEKKGTYIGVEDDSTEEDDEQCENNDAELADMFQEMTFALESCKKV